MKSSAIAVLTARLPLKSESLHYSVKDRVLSTYFQGMNRLLETYVTDDTLANTEIEIAHYVNPSTNLSFKFANEIGSRP